MIGVRPEGCICEPCSDIYQIGGICEVSWDMKRYLTAGQKMREYYEYQSEKELG
jgi:hypothetical protein